MGDAILVMNDPASGLPGAGKSCILSDSTGPQVTAPVLPDVPAQSTVILIVAPLVV
jgi:hypothetical protein